MRAIFCVRNCIFITLNKERRSSKYFIRALNYWSPHKACDPLWSSRVSLQTPVSILTWNDHLGESLSYLKKCLCESPDTTGCLLGNQACPHKKLYCVCDVWDLQRWPQSCLAIDSGYANWLWMSAVFCCYSKVHKSISESRVKEKRNALIWAQSTHTEVLPIKILNIEGNGWKQEEIILW